MKRLEVWTLDIYEPIYMYTVVHFWSVYGILVHPVHLIPAIIKDASESVIFVSFFQRVRIARNAERCTS